MDAVDAGAPTVPGPEHNDGIDANKRPPADDAERKRKLLEDALKKFKRAEDWEREDRRIAEEDLRFAAGDQWPDIIKVEREQQRRPTLVINRLRAAVKQVVNSVRRNRPSIKVLPVEDNDEDKAEIMQGLIRHIENASKAQSVYLPAFENAVKGGFRGSWRILTKYADEESFDQDVRLAAITSPFAVYWDPDSKELDHSDAKWCFVTEEVSKETFRERFPEAEPSNWESEYTGTLRRSWLTNSQVRMAEYWCVEEGDPKVLSLLEDGTVAEGDAEQFQMPDGSIRSRVGARQIPQKKVVRYLLSGHAVLEDAQVFPGKHIPIVSVDAPREWYRGKTRGVSLVRDAKDPQRQYNYWRTTILEKIALSPRAPFLVTPTQVKGFERYWNSANSANLPYLPYNPDPQAGGMPQRQMPATVNSAEIGEAQQAIDDIKATTGIFDASLGAQGNETSGKAILARQQQGDEATYDFVDALSMAIERTGRILVDIIPLVYNSPRALRILQDDGSKIASVINDSPDTQLIGKYDVEIIVGPSYATKRMEAADSMMAFVQAAPQVAQVAADLIVKNMDWPGAEDMAKRLKAALPPNLHQDDPSEMTPEEQQRMQQQQQQMQQQQEMQQQAFIADLANKQADAKLKMAQAEKAQLDAAVQAQQLQAMNGQIQQLVAAAVAQQLQALLGAPPQQ